MSAGKNAREASPGHPLAVTTHDRSHYLVTPEGSRARNVSQHSSTEMASKHSGLDSEGDDINNNVHPPIAAPEVYPTTDDEDEGEECIVHEAEVGGGAGDRSVGNNVSYVPRRRLRDVDDDSDDANVDDEHHRLLQNHQQRTFDANGRREAHRSRLSDPFNGSFFVERGSGAQLLASSPVSSDDDDDDDGDAKADDDKESDDSREEEEEAFYNSTAGTVLRVLGWACAYWLLPMWVIAGCLDSGVLGLLYLSMLIWVSFVPRVHQHVAAVTRIRDGTRSRITIAFAHAPTVTTLVASLFVSVAGVVLTGVHGVWWCNRNSSTTAGGGGGSSTNPQSPGTVAPRGEWDKAWSILGFNVGPDGSCDGADDVGGHSWSHIVILFASLLAIVGLRLQKSRDERTLATTPQRLTGVNTPFPVEWTPAGLVLLLMEVGGYVWVPWLCAVISIVLRPALLQLPDLVVSLAYILWVERYSPEVAGFPANTATAPPPPVISPKRGVTAARARVWLAYRPTVLWRYLDRAFQWASASAARERFWCRAYIVYVALSSYIYFGCLSLMRMGYTLYAMDPQWMRFLSSLDVDRGAAVSQLILSCCSIFVVSVVITLRTIDLEAGVDAPQRRGPRLLPKAHNGSWGARTSAPILTALHRFLHHAWYAIEAVLLFCLSNTAPSVFGCIWLLLWVVGLWAGGGQKQMHSVVVFFATIQFIGFFIGDLRVYNPALDEDNMDKSDVTVILGVRPFRRHAVELGVWILVVMLYNLCVLRYRRSRSRSRGGQNASLSSRHPNATSGPITSERSQSSYEGVAEQTPLCSPKSGEGWSGPAAFHGSFVGGAPGGGYGTNTPGTPTSNETMTTQRPSKIARLRTSTIASYVLESRDEGGGALTPPLPMKEDNCDSNPIERGRVVSFTPSKKPHDHLASTMPTISRRVAPIRREKSVVKKAVSTTEHYAVKLFQVFSELVRQYFFLVALAAIFVAAVVRVNVLHVAFLLLFGVCLLRKEFSIFAWGLVVLYSVAVLITQYVVVAFVPNPGQNWIQAGFTSSDGWDLWPYYLLAAIFLFQFRLYAITSIAELSDNVRRYLELAERVTIGLIVWLNVIFFSVLALMSNATLFALVYLSVFVTSFVVFLQAPSLHTPSRELAWFWYVVVFLNAVCGVTVYCYQLFPEVAEKTFTDIFEGVGLSLQETGIADNSIAALWPKLASLLLCVVQARAWHGRRSRLTEAIDTERGGGSTLGGTSTEQQMLLTSGFAAWSHTVFSSIVTAASTLALLLSRYSLPIAVVALFFGSAFGASTGSGRSWGGQSVVVQLLYFIVGCWMTTIPLSLKSMWLWRSVQVLSGVCTMAAFVLQFPGYPEAWATSLWPLYILVGVSCATHEMQWFVLMPHMVVFVTSSMHATFIAHASRKPLLGVLGPNGAASEVPPPQLDHVDQQPADDERGTDWIDIIYHPARHVRFFSFHASTGLMFINACVRRATVFGICFFALFVGIVMVGKTSMSRPYRWASLMVVVLITMCAQFALHLRPPPYSWGGATTLEAYKRQWMIMIGSPHAAPTYGTEVSWLVSDSDLVAYFELETSTENLILTMACWCAVVLHFVGLRAFRAQGSSEDPTRQKMSVTDRLGKYTAISLARRHGAMEFFKRLLPLPKGRRDFTRLGGGQSGFYRTSATNLSTAQNSGGSATASRQRYQRLFDRVQLFFYKRAPLMVLVAMFLHALYDGTTNLSVLKIMSLLLVVAFLQNLHRLPWRGNRWWRYLTAFHGLWFALRLVLFVPRIVRERWVVCGCQVLGILPHWSLMDRGQSDVVYRNIMGTSGAHCPGAPFSLTEFSLQAAILTLAVAQYAAFEKADYMFVLHHLHHQDVFSKCLGEAIRQTRRVVIQDAKHDQVEEGEQMAAQIERILEARYRRGCSGGARAVVEVHDAAEHDCDDDAVMADSSKLSPDTLDPSQPLFSIVPDVSTCETSAEQREETDDVGNVQVDDPPMNLRHLLDQTLDKRSLELLANIDGTDHTSHTHRRMAKTMIGHSMARGAAAMHPSPAAPLPQRSSRDVSEHGTAAARLSVKHESPASPRIKQLPLTTLPHNTATEDGDSGSHHRSASSSTSAEVYRTGSRASVHSTTRASITTSQQAMLEAPRGSGLRATMMMTWKSILRVFDGFILWLDRNSVGAGVVRLEPSMLRGHRLWFFFIGVYRCVFSFTHLIAYGLFCLQFALAPCALNAVLPVSVFGYAAMMNPRPHRGYWRFCLVYIQLMILSKCLIRIGYCEPNLVDDEGRSVQVQDPILDANWLYARTCTSDFFLVDVLMGLLCVLVTISHTAYLRSWGLWSDSELLPPPSATTLAAADGAGSSHRKSTTTTTTTGRSAHHASSPVPASDSLTVPEFLRSIVHNLRRDDVKLGTDMYRFGFACELLAVVIVFFGYYNLVGSADSLVNSLMNSLLPGTLAVLVLLLFTFIVVDRVIYLRRAIMGNVCLNVLYAVFYHCAMIWWFLHQTDFVRTYFRDASFGVRGSLGLAGLVYFLKCGYMMCNSIQIRSGLRPHATHIAFTGSYSSQEFVLYMISRLIPFVFDMRVILDWAVVPTALKLPYWMKQEDVAHELYSLMCDREDTRVAHEMNKHERRAPYPGIFRYGIGWALFLLLTAVLMFPLFLYSSFSPVLKDNWVESVTCTLALEGSPPLWSSASAIPKIGAAWNAAGAPFQLNNTVQELLERVRPSLVNAMIATDVTQQIPLNPFSNSLWAVSPPTLRDMLDTLASADSIALLLTVTIRNHAAIDPSSKSDVMVQQTILSPDTRGNFSAMLMGKQNATRIPNMFTPFLTNRQSGSASFEPINNGGNQLGSPNTVDCVLTTSGNVSDGSNALYFSLKCTTVFAQSNVYPGPWTVSPAEQLCLAHDVCPNYEDMATWNTSRFALGSPTVVIDSTAVLGASFLQTIGLVAAYTTFVLAIGRVLRFATTGSAFRTALEDLENPDELLTLLELIFFARSRGFFDAEMELYSELIMLVKVDEDRHRDLTGHRGLEESI